MFKYLASRIGKRTASNRTHLFLAVSVVILAAIAVTLASVAANDAILPRSNHAQAAQSASSTARANKTYTLYTGLWRTDGSFVSTIRIKNVLVVAPMDVTPVLFMADGTPFMLSSVHVAVSGVATVNVNDALAAAPSSIASHVSQFGSAALIYSYSSPGHVAAQMAAIDSSRSLSYTYSFVEPMDMPGHDSRQVLDGLWWKHDQGVTGFITLSNTTDQQQTASLTSVHHGNNTNLQQVTLAPHSTQMLTLEQIASEASGPGNRAGGIRVEYQGSQGAILVTGGLANESEGYSANMPFWFHDMSSSSPTQITYASAGLMLGKPDPMMMPGFPAETTFSVYLSLRNTTEKPLDVALQLNYMSGMGMEGSMPVTRNLAAQHLAPFEAKQVDLQGALNAAGLKNFNGSINLSTSITGRGGDLVVASGSVDQTGTYVFEVDPQSIGTTMGRYSGYWSVTNGNDSMISLWNPTTAAQDLIVTLYYGDGSGKYNLPVHLAPQGSAMIDIAMLIAEIKPDAAGHVIPQSVKEGSASIASTARDGKMTVVLAGGVFNVSTATCGVICYYCNGYGSSIAINPNPIGVAVGGNVQCSITATDSYGNPASPGGATWSTSDTSGTIVSVNQSGNVTGIGLGSATIYATFQNIMLIQGNYCTSQGNQCPLTNYQAEAPANVQVPVPTSLEVLSTQIISLTYWPNSSCPAGDNSFGIALAINYQVLDQNSNPMASSQMEPQEKLVNWIYNGSPQPDPTPNWGDIGPSPYPGTSQFTNSNGQFTDAPLGFCFGEVFTSTLDQPMSILLNGTRYPTVTGGIIRTNHWSAQSTSAGHGSVTNNNDVSRSR